MTTNNTVFQSDYDDKYYFWLGDGLSKGYHEAIEAHQALTKHLEEAHGDKKEGCTQSRC